MNKENIHIDLDEDVVHFISKNTNEKEDKISEYITDIVYIGCRENNVVSDNIFISITSATKEEIREINNEYRNIDRATDVLSFPIFENLIYISPVIPTRIFLHFLLSWAIS